MQSLQTLHRELPWQRVTPVTFTCPNAKCDLVESVSQPHKRPKKKAEMYTES